MPPESNSARQLPVAATHIRPDSEFDWNAFRRKRPPEGLLPETEKWAEALPDGMKPKNLLAMYPRIANRLAVAWRNASDVQDVLDDLMIDRRGGRRGFPPPVHADLVRLCSVIEASPRFGSARVRIHVSGAITWALSRCRACGEVHKYRLADALAGPVACRRCRCRMNIRSAVVQELDRRIAASPYANPVGLSLLPSR